MAVNFKLVWILMAMVIVVAVACSGSDYPDPTATPEPTATPIPAIDLAALGVEQETLDTLGITEADVQCLAVQVEREIVEQMLLDDLTPADALSVLPALQACDVDLVQLLEGANDFLAESAGADYQGLDSLPFTAEQIACIALVVDAETLEALVGGEATMTSIAPVLEAFTACGTGLADLLAIASEAGASTDLDDLTGGDPVIELEQIVPGGTALPDGSGLVETGDLGDIAGDLPFTAEQLECLTNEIDLEEVETLAAGELNPLAMLSFLGVLNTCGVSLDELGN